MERDYEPKRALKIWDVYRAVRKSVIVGSIEELYVKGRERLGIPSHEPVIFVLDCDGTQVEDWEYVLSLPVNTVLLVLRPGEYWFPARFGFLHAAVNAVPRVVCETIQSLELEDETPCWKIMDNKGKVTVVLHWDNRRGTQPPRMHVHVERTPPPRKHQQVHVPPNVERSKTTITPSGKKETLINDIYPPPPKYSNNPQITVIDHDEEQKTAPDPRRMPYSSSVLSSSIHIHTVACAANAHEPAARAASPDNGATECDFHCCSLHEQGRAIVVEQSVITSPKIDAQLRKSPPASALSDGKKSGVKQHVRFLDVEGGTTFRPGQSDSESEDSTGDEDSVKTNKYLLLVDELTKDRRNHLSIKDIGVILERLSSTILDVEKLNRDPQSKKNIRNWTIKATIRGIKLNELGLVYNGVYFAVCEHPDYKKDESKEVRTFRRDLYEEHRL